MRGTLERWGLLEEGSPKGAVFERLGMDVTKISDSRHSVLQGVLGYLERNPTDLIVLATEGRAGIPAWIRPSIAETVARKSKTMTLFVPQDARGFVDIESGEITLKRILVPVDHKPNPGCARPALSPDPRDALTLNHSRTDRPIPSPLAFVCFVEQTEIWDSRNAHSY